MTSTTPMPTSFRLGAETRRQLDELAAQYKTMSTALTVAVDRLYRAHDPLDDSDGVLDIEVATGLDGYWERSPWWEFAHDGVYVDRAATQAEYTEEVFLALRKRWPEARVSVYEQDTLPQSEHAQRINGVYEHPQADLVESEVAKVFGRLGELTVTHHYSVEPCPAAELVALRDQVAEVTERYGGAVEAASLHIDRQPEPIEILYVHAIGRAGLFDCGTEVWLDATSAEDAARHYLGAGIGG